MKLEEIKSGAVIKGIDQTEPVRIVSVDAAGSDAVTVYYKTTSGKLLERMLFRSDEAKLVLEAPGRPWSFDAPAEDYKLVLEALRINVAHLFDPMMAVHTSNVEPLPHQVTAVYESMLPRQPLRYVLADDPGAGKTIMAGLFLRELIMRADARRILVVAPGGLVDQWQDEMYEKFGVYFEIFSREMEMNRADRLDDASRKGTVGFALTCLQRRLASSPEAIYQSLVRRCKRLQLRLEEEKTRQRQGVIDTAVSVNQLSDDEEDFPSRDDEETTEEVVCQATAAETVQELEAEIVILKTLIEKALKVRHSGQDKKWEELSKLLQNDPEMQNLAGHHRKLIIFTEHRDTLNYLADRIKGVLGNPDAAVIIHGGTPREERRKIQELFRNDKDVRVLIATDAAGEGINLQCANLMVNYDLPWNPNRIEQRFGRIHRIGQTEVCHLWNLVAIGTRESAVFEKLCDKLEAESKALNGRVFNVLGAAFEGSSLKDLLIQAIRYGDDPAVKARLQEQVDGVLDHKHLQELLKRNALCEEFMDEKRLFAVKEEMEKAQARKLQPYFIKAFFNKAFQALGGEFKPREVGRFEISHVPAIIRERDRQITGRDRRNVSPVTTRYERICFEKQYVHLDSKPMASLIHPGHPLMQAVTDLIIEQHRDKIRRGSVLIDTTDCGTTPKLLLTLDHAVKEGTNQDMIVSRRMQFVYIDAERQVTNAGWAPHLDLRPLSVEEARLLDDIVQSPKFGQDLEQAALGYASSVLVPDHFREVKDRREAMVDKTLNSVQERLVKEISYWSDRYIKLQEDMSAGKDVRLTVENVRRTIDDLTARLETRKKELEGMRQVISATPVIVGTALVIPQGLLMQRTGNPDFCDDPEARKRIEDAAMKAVIVAEETKGFVTNDVSAQKCGWDVTSRSKPGIKPEIVRHIEVKGRAKDATTITVTRNEIMYALNQSDKFILAIVTVDGDRVDGPHYVQKPFTVEPDWAVTSINFDMAQLLSNSKKS